MADHLPAMNRLLNDNKLLDLCRRHPGLHRYVSSVESTMLKLLSAAKDKLAPDTPTHDSKAALSCTRRTLVCPEL